jgi:hypothetical protein
MLKAIRLFFIPGKTSAKRIIMSPIDSNLEILKNYTDRVLPKIKMITAKTKKIKNKILAISIAEPAIRVNPNSAATIAITKNVAAHRNIVPSPSAGRQALFLSSLNKRITYEHGVRVSDKREFIPIQQADFCEICAAILYRDPLQVFYNYNSFADIFNMFPRILYICSRTSHCVTS